jgi:hypothetical protein
MPISGGDWSIFGRNFKYLFIIQSPNHYPAAYDYQGFVGMNQQRE